MVKGDFNNDGRLDVATAAQTGPYGSDTFTVTVILGVGGGAMAETARIELSAAPGYGAYASLAVGDFDGDGKLDLVAARTVLINNALNSETLLFRGDGAGGLMPPALVIRGGWSSALAVADFDGDGRLDIAVADQNQVLVLRGLGDGSFQAPKPIANLSGAVNLLAADLDLDGRPDLVVSAYPSGLSVLLNAGTAGFRTAFESPEFAPYVGGLGVGDVDGNGIPDLILGGTQGVGVFNGLGDGTFDAPVWKAVEGSVLQLAVGDFNRDKRADVAANGIVLIADLFGTLQVSSALPGSGALIGDFDGDGWDDAVLTGGGLSLGRGDGTFLTERVLGTVGYVKSLALTDVNGDGEPDLAWINLHNGFGTMLGDGLGGFSPAAMTDFPVPYAEGVFADVTGDGIPDAVVAASAQPPNAIYVLPGDGTGRFGSPIVTPFTGYQQSAPVVADFDGDHRNDVALMISDGTLVVFLGDGTGRFPTSKPPLAVPYGYLINADLNGDGKPDLVIVRSNGDLAERIVTLVNDGTGSFAIGADLVLPSFFSSSVRLMDADGDGKPDLLTTSFQGVSFRKGDGLGGFGSAIDTAVVNAWDLVAADFDGDGKLDLATGLGWTTVLKGVGDGTFLVTGAYPWPLRLSLAGDVNGDGKPDILGTFNGRTWLVSNTTCEARRLQLEAWPSSCGTAGAPFGTQPTVRVFDDGGNPIVCGSTAVTVSLLPGSGSPGAVLNGALSAPLTGGVAQFSNLSIDTGGGGYRLRFDLAGARSTATPPFSQSLSAPLIVGPAQACASSSTRFDGGADADSWTWTLDGATVGTQRFLTLPPLAAGMHTLGLIVRKDACTSTRSRSLPVAAAVPVPTASSNSPVPFGGALQLHAIAISGATYRWSGPNGFSSSLQNPTIAVATDRASGRYVVTALVGSCSSPAGTTDVVVQSSSCGGCRNASFAQGIRALPVPDSLVRIALADFDGDGLADILTAHAGGSASLALLRGNGRGGFESPVASSPNVSQFSGMATADLDGNGLRDVVSGSYPGVAVILQTAPGHFGAAAVLPTGFPVSDVVIADVNGDGFPDILAANTPTTGFGISVPGSVSVFLGDGSGGFGAPSSVPVERAPWALLVGDIDGDGRPDLLVANKDSKSVSVFRGDGTGGFVLRATLAVPGDPVALALGNVTGDAAPDLVVGVAGAEEAAVIFEGSAVGTFVFVRSFPINLDRQLALADLDRDGRPDLVTLASGSVWVWKGEGSAVFSAPVSYAVAALGDTLTVGDFNGDGVPDVVVGEAALYPVHSRVALLSGDGTGALSQTPSLGPSQGTIPLVKALDMNADGNEDLLLLKSAPYPPSLETLLADGIGGFGPGIPLTAPLSFVPDSFTVGDVDGDGIPDVVEIENYAGRVAVFRGLGNGLFGVPVVTDVGRPIALLASGDLDGDGRMDLVLGAYPQGGGPLSVVLSNGASGFLPPIDSTELVQASAAGIGDFDRDGKRDVVVADTGRLSISVFPWNGTGFSAPIRTPLDGAPNAMAVGDFDGDGKLDVVINVTPQLVNSQLVFEFLPGNGAGGFGLAHSFGPSQVSRTLAVSDFNGDGKLDLAAVLADTTTIAVFMGDGSGGFAAPSEYAGGPLSGALAVADFDRDGRQDLAFSQSYPTSVRILFNSNCVPRRLGVTSNPSCVAPGQSFAAEARVFDDGDNVIACDSGTVSAALVGGTGAAGAVLSGTANVAAASGVASFTGLSIDRAGKGYEMEFHHPVAKPARSAPFLVGFPAPSSIAGPPQLCAGTSSWEAPRGYDTYSWTLDGTPISSLRTVRPAFMTAGTHALGLSVTTERCEARTSTTISNAPPSLTAIAPASGVSQGGTLVTAIGSCFAPAATVSLDAPTDPYIATPTSLQVVTEGHVPATVGAVVTNPDGQTAVLPAAYTYVCDTLPPVVSNNGPICAGSFLSLRAPFFEAATYAWSGPNGFTANTRFGLISAATTAASGVYTVTITNVSGCALSPASTTAVVKPAPSAQITVPASVEAWSTGNVASIPDPGPGEFSNWYVTTNNATITSGASTNVVTFSVGVSGDITLGVSVSGPPGSCGAGAQRTISITPKATQFYPITPCRLADTRLSDGPGGGPAVSAGVPRFFPITGLCGIPEGAVAVSLNATVTGPTSSGALRLFASGTTSPPTTNLSFSAGQTRAESSIVMMGSDGKLVATTTQASGTANVVLDANGYLK